MDCRVFLGCAVAAFTTWASMDSALAQTGIQLSTGVNYSTGSFGEASDTDVIVVPLGAKITRGDWAFRVSLPLVSVDGPADISVVLDDSGGGSGSSGGSSGSSGTSGSGRDHPEDSGTPTPPGTVTSIAGGKRKSGIGDATVSATYSFNEIAGSNMYADVMGRVRLPTGDDDKGLGSGAVDYGLASEVGAEFDRGGVYVVAGRRFLGDANGLHREDGWQAGAGFWIDAGDRASMGASIDWRESADASGEEPTDIGAYVTYKITDSWRVGLNATAGLNDASPDVGLGASLVWRAQERRN